MSINSSIGNYYLDRLSFHDEWTSDGYYLTHKPSDTSFWIANGFWFFKIGSRESREGLNLGAYWKIRLYWRTRRMLKAKKAETLQRELRRLEERLRPREFTPECKPKGYKPKGYKLGGWIN